MVAAAVPPDPYAIYARARRHWAAQTYPVYLSYTVRISGDLKPERITNTYASFTDTATGVIKVRATSAEEAAAPPDPHGVTWHAKITIGYTRHPSLFKPPSLDGNSEISVSKTVPISTKQQFDLLGVPLLSPTYSFGLTPPRDPAAHVQPSAAPALRTIASVTAVRRDYNIRYEGEESVDGAPCYHLALTPRRKASVLRLRELWIDEQTYATRQAQVQGNFTQGPGPTLPWLIRFSEDDGVVYIAEETALAPVRYLGHTYDDVTIRFADVQPQNQMGLGWSLSLFRTSGDVLEEP